jgi:hypothetical protein
MTQVRRVYGVTSPIIQTAIGDMFAEMQGFDFLYVSIGGKWNESIVPFPDRRNDIVYTNSKQQMYPRFLQNRPEDKKFGVIAFDDFRNKDEFEKNVRYIQQVAEENATVMVVSHHFSVPTLTSITNYLLELCVKYGVTGSQVMITNFVKHRNTTNFLETRDEKMIPITIQSVLGLTCYTDYKYCLYEWFGYRYYTYQLVYQYLWSKDVIPFLYYDLEHCLRCLQDKKGAVVIQQDDLFHLLDHVYDISCSTDGLISLKNYLLQQDRIIVSIRQPEFETTGLSISV